MARERGATNVARLEAVDADGLVDLLIVSLDNAGVGPLLDDLQRLPDLRVTFAPQGVLALRPPAGEAPDQVRDVEPRSPIEVFLSALQSVGSWKGFLGYAFLSGVVVWIGLFTNTPYLLTAAMLIAPYAGPAMNVAVATARGDRGLIARGGARYFAGLAVGIATCAALTLLFDLKIPTTLMVETSQLSTVAVLLPLAAGAAGALNLSQSERSSLVSGAATGMLVAASLAPATGIVGMAAVLGRGDMVVSALQVLALQIVAINLAGALVFRAFGLAPQGPRYTRGDGRTVVLSLAVTVLAIAALLTWQLSTRPDLQHASRAQRAAEVVSEVVSGSPVAKLVEANVRFTRAEIPGQETLLGVLYVQRTTQAAPSDGDIARQLRGAIGRRLRERGFHVTPLVDITVLAPPEAP